MYNFKIKSKFNFSNLETEVKINTLIGIHLVFSFYVMEVITKHQLS